MRPRVEAIVLCEGLHRDTATGKHTLLGTFNSLTTALFPATARPFWVFLVLTAMRSPAQIVVQAVRVADEDLGESVVLRSPLLVVPGNDPLAIVEVTVQVQELVLESPGEYRVQVLSDQELIADKRFMVREA